MIIYCTYRNCNTFIWKINFISIFYSVNTFPNLFDISVRSSYRWRATMKESSKPSWMANFCLLSWLKKTPPTNLFGFPYEKLAIWFSFELSCMMVFNRQEFNWFLFSFPWFPLAEMTIASSGSFSTTSLGCTVQCTYDIKRG